MATIDCLIAWDGERIHDVFVDTKAAYKYANQSNVSLYDGKITMGARRYKPNEIGMSRRRAKYGKTSRKGRH
jgi:hypothetical protein